MRGERGKLIENILTNTKLNKQYKKDNFAKNGNPDSMRERGSFIIRFFFYAMLRKMTNFILKVFFHFQIECFCISTGKV